jgi:hypothetical protein
LTAGEVGNFVMAFRNPIVQGASVSGFIFANRDEGTKMVDIDLIGSPQLARTGWVKGVGAAMCSDPRRNLTGDPYFTDGYRAVLVFDHSPSSFIEIEKFDREQPISSRLKRLATGGQQDFDGQ